MALGFRLPQKTVSPTSKSTSLVPVRITLALARPTSYSLSPHTSARLDPTVLMVSIILRSSRCILSWLRPNHPVVRLSAAAPRVNGPE